jgi:KDO2-lipid IV(A) lauroyltransferase
LWTLTLLLPYRALLALGRWCGHGLAWLPGYRRTVAETNLRLCFPELDDHARRTLYLRQMESLGMSVVEMALNWWAPEWKLHKLTRIEGLDHLRTALDAGHGAILLSGHFGALEIGGRLLLRHTPACYTYQDLSNPVFDRIVLRGRLRRCPCMIYRNDMRSLLRALKDGQAVWYAPDQDLGERQSVFVPFFGIPAATLTATSRIAGLTGARVLPFIVERLPKARGYRLAIEPPLENFPGDDPVADTQRLNTLLEAQIRAMPEQYVWVHRRFKTRPEGVAKLYPTKPSRLRKRARAARRQPG